MLDAALPDDPQALKALIGELVGQLDAKHQAITSLEQRVADLQLQIAVLRRARFGRRSEKLDQQLAHNFYPTHLWRNGERVELDNEYFHPHQRFDGDDRAPTTQERQRLRCR